MLNITVTILSKNSASKIAAALESLKDFVEVIVLDSGSTDETKKIATSYSNVKYFESDFLGFGPMKQKASSFASCDWILNVDSDEFLSKSLLEKLKGLVLNEQNVYSFSRRNHYRGKWIKGCDWYPDSVIRLYNKKITNYNEAQVHEKVVTPRGGKLIYIAEPIMHYPYEGVGELIFKMGLYSNLYASENHGLKRSFLNVLARVFIAFVKNYVIKRGFLLGREGFLISYYNASGVFFKNVMLLEKNESEKL